eukprot:4236365-Prymnesium_polylepis.1
MEDDNRDYRHRSQAVDVGAPLPAKCREPRAQYRRAHAPPQRRGAPSDPHALAGAHTCAEISSAQAAHGSSPLLELARSETISASGARLAASRAEERGGDRL